MIDTVLDMTSIYQAPDNSSSSGSDSFSVIHLDNGMVLYLCFVNSQLALVSLIRSENFRKQGLIEYNFQVVSKSIVKVLFT